MNFNFIWKPKLYILERFFFGHYLWIGKQITQDIATFVGKETGQWNSVTNVDECKPLSQTNIHMYVWILSNLLPAPFIPLSPVSWSATGSQVEICHHELFKKTNRLPAVHQVLTNAATENGWISLVSHSLFFTPFVSSAFDPRRSLSLILTYVRAAHKSILAFRCLALGSFRDSAREEN